MSSAHCYKDENLPYSVGFGNDLVQIFDEGRIKVEKIIKDNTYDIR